MEIATGSFWRIIDGVDDHSIMKITMEMMRTISTSLGRITKDRCAQGVRHHRAQQCCRLPRPRSRCCMSCLQTQLFVSSLLLSTRYGRGEIFVERRRCPFPRQSPQSHTVALPIASCRRMTNGSFQNTSLSPDKIKYVNRMNRFSASCTADACEEKDALADCRLSVAAACAD